MGGEGNDGINVRATGADEVGVSGNEGRDRIRVAVSRDTETNVVGGPGRDSVRVSKRSSHGQDRHNHHPPRGESAPDQSRELKQLSNQADVLFSRLGRATLS